MERGLRWVVDVDISKYFDTIDHAKLREFLDQRVTDGVVRKMIDKWLKAGALDKGVLTRTTGGTPQGGVISPLLSNIYLHHVLDEWFEVMAEPKLKGRCQLVRYADDAVIALEDFRSGKRMLAVLGKRLEPVRAHAPSDQDPLRGLPVQTPARATSRDGRDDVRLSRLHPCVGKSWKGKDVVRQITAKDRYKRALAAVTEWCRRKFAPPVPGTARPPVANDPGALRLLWRLGKQQATTLVSPPARADMERNGLPVAAATAICRGRASMPCSRDTPCRLH